MNSWDKYKLDHFSQIFFSNKLVENETQLKELFTNSYNELNAKLEVVEQTVRHASHNKWKEMVYIWNLSGFILTTSLDLKIYGENLFFQSGYGKKELQIKNLCVLIYETSEDIEQLLGKQFYDICTILKIPLEIINELKIEKKKLSQFKSEHQSSLKSIRTIIGAHRDHDFLLQIDTVKSLSNDSFLTVITSFDKILNNLSIPLQKILNQGTNNFVNNLK